MLLDFIFSPFYAWSASLHFRETFSPVISKWIHLVICILEWFWYWVSTVIWDIFINCIHSIEILNSKTIHQKYSTTRFLSIYLLRNRGIVFIKILTIIWNVFIQTNILNKSQCNIRQFCLFPLVIYVCRCSPDKTNKWFSSYIIFLLCARIWRLLYYNSHRRKKSTKTWNAFEAMRDDLLEREFPDVM